MFNTLDGFINLAEARSATVSSHHESSISINRVGDSLEKYIKDGFSNILNKDLDDNKKNEIYNEIFSYTGSQNNPPDLMIRHGDAIEIKKHKTYQRHVQLNSSPPRQILSSTDPMINQEAKNCEEWDQKDVVYCLGWVVDESIRKLWFVYGDCFLASSDGYKKVTNEIKKVLENADYPMAKTKELGRINNYDPLGYSSLRIRGMWAIKHPRYMFEKYTNVNSDGIYFVARKEKYKKFDSKTLQRLKQVDNIKSQDFEIEDPDKPERTIECKILKYEV